MEALSDPSYNAAAHEDEPTDIPVGIVIRNLTKIYNRRVSTFSVILNNNYNIDLSLNYFKLIILIDTCSL